jgi:hypothetical protein
MGWRDRLLGGAEAARRERLRSLIAARRRMVDQPYAGVPGSNPSYRVVPRGRAVPIDAATQAEVSAALQTALAGTAARAEVNKGSAVGVFATHPGMGDTLGVVTYPELGYAIRRHEVMHGLNHAAMQGVPGMPLASRVIASLPAGLARPLDEAVASRVGGKPVLDVPWNVYADRYRKEGSMQAARVAQALYAAQQARNAARAAGRVVTDNPTATAAALATGGGVLYGLSLEDDPSGQ